MERVHPRLKFRVHPGRMAYTTTVCSGGREPEWKEHFLLPVPGPRDPSPGTLFAPCISFRYALAGWACLSALSGKCVEVNVSVFVLYCVPRVWIFVCTWRDFPTFGLCVL